MKNKQIQLTAKRWIGMDKKAMRETLRTIYQTYIGTTVINKETHMRIEFNRRGKKKTLLYLKENDKIHKATVIENLPKLLRFAELIKVEDPIHNTYAQKAFTFLIECVIDGEQKEFKAIVMKKKDGCFQYDLYQNPIE